MPLVRRMIRKVLTTYYKPGRFYRIPFGANRGKFIEYASSMNLDMMLGFHEPNTFEVLLQLVRPGMVVADIGAHRGYFSVFLNDLVSKGGVVYAFEPLPENCAALERTLKQNNCHQVSVVQKAVTDVDADVFLLLSDSPYMSSLSVEWIGEGKGKIDVDGVRLDSFMGLQHKAVDFIKMDIEGGGVYALPGMTDLIQFSKPYLLVESHTPSEDRAIGEALSLIDYAVFRVGSDIPVLDLTADYKDRHGVWGTVVGIPRERLLGLPDFAPLRFQRWRLGQRHSLWS